MTSNDPLDVQAKSLGIDTPAEQTSMRRQKNSRIGMLHHLLQIYIASFLPRKDLDSLMQVSADHCTVVQDELQNRFSGACAAERNVMVFEALKTGRTTEVMRYLECANPQKSDTAETLEAHPRLAFNVNKASGADRKTLLHLAAAKGYVEIVFALIAADADVEINDHSGRPPIFQAVMASHWETVEALLAWGADANVAETSGLTSLHFAALEGHLPTVAILLENTAAPTAIDQYGRTALHLATSKGHVDIMKLLISAGVPIEASDTTEATALSYAAAAGQVEAVKVLLAENANPVTRDQEGKTALHLAASEGHISVVNLLVSSRVPINALDNERGTPLLRAARAGHLLAAKALLDEKADATAPDSSGNTPLHHAASKGDFRMARLLLPDAPINARNRDGETPLHAAARAGSRGVVRLLCFFGEDVHAKTHEKATALHCAAKSWRDEDTPARSQTIRHLLYEGVPVNAVDAIGRTALHYAAVSGVENVIDILIAHGANANAIDAYGHSPLSGAVLRQNLSIVEKLRAAGSSPKVDAPLTHAAFPARAPQPRPLPSTLGRLPPSLGPDR